MGTPDFAACILKELAQWPCGEILAAYTQPDRPAGRGHKLTPSPVKRLARELGFPVLQPQSLKCREAQEELAAFAPDLLVVAAYGLILPDAVLAVPRLAPINVHASLLPRYRGAAPIQRAIMENWGDDAQTGVSIMRIGSRLDAGPVYDEAAMPIGEHTAGSLHDALADLGSQVLLSVLGKIVSGTAQAKEQDESLADYAAKIGKKDGDILWDRPAAAVHAQIRAVTPWPGARARFAFQCREEPVALLLSPGSVGERLSGEAPGVLRRGPDGLSVACADCWYKLAFVRPQGRKDMAAMDFVNGFLRGLPEGLCGSALPLD